MLDGARLLLLDPGPEVECTSSSCDDCGLYIRAFPGTEKIVRRWRQLAETDGVLLHDCSVPSALAGACLGTKKPVARTPSSAAVRRVNLRVFLLGFENKLE